MRRGSLLAAVGAAASLAAAIIVWVLAYRTPFGARLDATTLNGFVGLSTPGIEAVARSVVQLADPVPYALWTTAIVSLALFRRRPRLACLVLVVLVGANLTTQALQPVTAMTRGIDSLSDGPLSLELWPSGHTTAAMALALCLVAVAPPRLRPLAAALGGAFALGVVYSLLVLGWHYPSDVVGGFCVAAAWTLAGLATIWAVQKPRPAGAAHAQARTRDTVLAQAAPAALTALGVAGLIAAAALARPETAFAYAQANTAFILAATALGSGAFALTAALATALRAWPRR
jgi:membrane-associated phospholipid phosphatase